MIIESTPDEIHRACEDIRARWSVAEKRSRLAAAFRHEPCQPPVVDAVEDDRVAKFKHVGA